MHRTVVVTGAARGIGLATCSRFAAEGWSVIGVDRDAVPDSSGAGLVVEANLGDALETVRAARSIRDRTSAVTALVNCAGVQLSAPIATTTDADWDRVMAVNVRAPFLLVRELAKELRGGAVVNVASVHAIATSSQVAAYAASKGALVALTRALAVELATQTIRVNAVLPGATDTQMLREGLQRAHLGAPTSDHELIDRLAARTPASRIALAAEIAEVILFFADSARSGFVTGAALVVDGGVTAKLASE